MNQQHCLLLLICSIIIIDTILLAYSISEKGVNSRRVVVSEAQRENNAGR